MVNADSSEETGRPAPRALPPETALREVLSYAVDGQQDSQSAKVAQEYDLSVETFYGTLYEDEPEIENEILLKIESLDLPVVVKGPEGCGKTSITWSALRQYSEKHKVPHIRIDFKANRLGSLDIRRSGETSRIEEWISEEIYSFLGNHIVDHDLDRDAIDAVCLERNARGVIDIPDVNEIRYEIHREYKRARRRSKLNEENFEPWFLNELQKGEPPAVAHIESLSQALKKSGERATALAYCLCRFLRPDAPSVPRIPVFLDNIDSVEKQHLRSLIFKAVGRLQHGCTASIRFLLASRPENLRDLDHASDKDSERPEDVYIGYADLVTQVGDDPPVETPSATDERHRSRIDRRLRHFAAKASELGEAEPAEVLLSWCQLVNNIRGLTNVQRWAAGLSKRRHAEHFHRFVLDMHRRYPGKLSSEVLGEGTRASRALSSLYYSWIGDLHARSGAGPYDWGRAVRAWQRPTPPDGAGTAPMATLSCIIPHLILTAIFNETRCIPRMYDFTPHVEFDHLAKLFDRLGVGREALAWELYALASRDVVGRLVDLDLVLDDGIHPAGRLSGVEPDLAAPGIPEGAEDEMFEAAELPPPHHAIVHCKEIKLTPRGKMLVEHLGTSFFYFFANVAHHRKVSLDQGAWLQPRSEHLDAGLDALEEFAEMTLHGVEEIRELSDGLKGWFDDYQTVFCMERGAANSNPPERRRLLIENMIHVQESFLGHRVSEWWPHGNFCNNGHAQRLRSIREKFETLLDQILAGDDLGKASTRYQIRTQG